MKAEYKDQLAVMVTLYGAYEVVKALSKHTEALSKEYHSLGNHGAIIHTDSQTITAACKTMAVMHPLRSKDVIK